MDNLRYIKIHNKDHTRVVIMQLLFLGYKVSEMFSDDYISLVTSKERLKYLFIDCDTGEIIGFSINVKPEAFSPNLVYEEVTIEELIEELAR